MESNGEKNRVYISGWVKADPVHSHYFYGESFYTFEMIIPRLSGVEDIIPVTVSERLMSMAVPEAGKRFTVTGQLRSYNKHIEGANRLILTVFARTIEEADENDEFVNDIYLDGYICKPPVYRTTPFCREIADILLAVNRSYNKSDYLPCIVWGRNARFSNDLMVGSRVCITGRLQSREYQKKLPDGNIVVRTTYEVSGASIVALEY